MVKTLSLGYSKGEDTGKGIQEKKQGKRFPKSYLDGFVDCGAAVVDCLNRLSPPRIPSTGTQRRLSEKVLEASKRMPTLEVVRHAVRRRHLLEVREEGRQVGDRLGREKNAERQEAFMGDEPRGVEVGAGGVVPIDGGDEGVAKGLVATAGKVDEGLVDGGGGGAEGGEGALDEGGVVEAAEKDAVEAVGGGGRAKGGDGKDVKVGEVVGDEGQVVGDVGPGVEVVGRQIDIAVDLGEEQGDRGPVGEAVEIIEAGVGDPDGVGVANVGGEVAAVVKVEQHEDLVGIHKVPKEGVDVVVVGLNALTEGFGVGVVLGVEEGEAEDLAGIIEDVEGALGLAVLQHVEGKVAQGDGLVQ